jgi:glycosyltransferase involved in cell wall biosynthesis
MPRLSVLALCFNHSAYLEEALQSLSGLPPEIEVLVADDASTDHSSEILRRWQKRCPQWRFIFHVENKGNCATFNELLGMASGDWILDFATDDVLIPGQLLPWAETAAAFPGAGFCYADARIFSRQTGTFHRFSQTRKGKPFPEGQILQEVFSPGLICPPAVLFSRKALLETGGYNEGLSYEDLDIWLRLARKYPVCRYNAEVINYRQHAESMSARIYLGRNQRHLQSTLEILTAVLTWPEFQPLPDSLEAFIRYQLRLCFFLQLPEEAFSFYALLERNRRAGFSDRLLWRLSGKLPGIQEIYGLIHQGRRLLAGLF